MSQSFYELLEVGASASFDEIESAYQRIVSYLDTSSLAIYSMMEEDEVARMRSAVDEAYRTLSDPERRAAYDRALSDGDDYFPVIVPDVPSDSNVSMGHVGPDSFDPVPDRRQEMSPPPPVAPHPHPVASPTHAPPPPAPAEVKPLPRNPEPEVEPPRNPEVKPLPRNPEPARPALKTPPVRRLTPTLELEIGSDTEFSGALLRRLRESAEATLEDLSEITKISKHYLHALEENDFSALPAAVYVRGFVSEYARALGMDNQAVAKSYMALYQRYKQEGGK